MEPHRIDAILNRELAKYFVGCPKVDRLTCLVPPGQDIVAKDASDTTKIGVHLVEAQHCLDPDTSLSLSLPPDDLQKIDVVIGHGNRLGPQAQRIRNSRECQGRSLFTSRMKSWGCSEE